MKSLHLTVPLLLILLLLSCKKSASTTEKSCDTSLVIDVLKGERSGNSSEKESFYRRIQELFKVQKQKSYSKREIKKEKKSLKRRKSWKMDFKDAALRLVSETFMYNKSKNQHFLWTERVTSYPQLHSFYSLSLWRTDAKDLRVVKYLPNLEYLNIGRTAINELYPLEGLAHLKELDLEWKKVEDYSPISSLHSLEKLSMRNSNVTDLSFLQNLHCLKVLDLSDIRALEDLSGLEHVPQLEELDLCHSFTVYEEVHDINEYFSKVSDISPIAKVTSLKGLNLSMTGVKDLSPLKNLKNLESLDISHTPVVDLMPLKKLKNLRFLNLYKFVGDNNSWYISDYSPLYDLQNLKEVNINEGDITDEQLDDLKAMLPQVNITFNRTYIVRDW